MLPALTQARVGWLEEPFPPYQDRSWRAAAQIATLPLAGGENCYTRYDFQRLVDAGCVSVVQPDLSRCGGITDALRIAALASAAGLPVCTHGCHTGLNMAASVHFLASIDNAWYFEGDGSTDNLFRTRACSASYELAADGTVTPLEGPGSASRSTKSSSRGTRSPKGRLALSACLPSARKVKSKVKTVGCGR